MADAPTREENPLAYLPDEVLRGEKPIVRQHFSADKSSIPLFLLGGLALGGGARLAKNMVDLFRSDDVTAPRRRIKKRRVPRARTPVNVTPEQAHALRAQGIAVREVLKKRAADAPSTMRTNPTSIPEKDWNIKYKTDKPSALGAVGLGVLGTGGLLGGWYLTDLIIDKMRERAAKKDIERVRSRIRRTLQDEPAGVDSGIYGSMKAAEDYYFSKTAEEQKQMQKEAFGMRDLWWALPMLLGGGITLNALAGFQKAKRESPHDAKAKALKRYLERRRIPQPTAGLEPVLEVDPEEERRQEAEREKKRIEALRRRIAELQAEKPGSPSVQAATPVIEVDTGPNPEPPTVTVPKSAPAVAAAAPAPAGGGSNWF